MKKILAFFFVCLAASAQAKFIAESVTQTANGSDELDTTLNAPFGIGDDGRLHRFKVNNNGELQTGFANFTTVTANQGAAGATAWPVTLPAYTPGNPLSVSLPAYTAANPLSVTLPAYTASNPLQVSGTGTANQGGAGTQNWFMAVTSPPTALNTSRTSRTISQPVTVNVSHVAGVGAPAYEFAIGITGTTGTGIMWAETGSATWPCNACFTFLAVNNLEVRVPNRYAGTHYHLSPVSATDISATAALGVQPQAVRQ